MYLFRPKKGYDPSPYPYIKRWWHGIVGCPMNTAKVELRRNYNGNSNKQYPFELCESCGCGRIFITQVVYPRH